MKERVPQAAPSLSFTHLHHWESGVFFFGSILADANLERIVIPSQDARNAFKMPTIINGAKPLANATVHDNELIYFNQIVPMINVMNIPIIFARKANATEKRVFSNISPVI